MKDQSELTEDERRELELEFEGYWEAEQARRRRESIDGFVEHVAGCPDCLAAFCQVARDKAKKVSA